MCMDDYCETCHKIDSSGSMSTMSSTIVRRGSDALLTNAIHSSSFQWFLPFQHDLNNEWSRTLFKSFLCVQMIALNIAPHLFQYFSLEPCPRPCWGGWQIGPWSNQSTLFHHTLFLMWHHDLSNDCFQKVTKLIWCGLMTIVRLFMNVIHQIPWQPWHQPWWGGGQIDF